MAGGGMGMGGSGGGGSMQDLNQLSSILQRFGGGAGSGGAAGTGIGNPMTNMGLQMMMQPPTGAPPAAGMAPGRPMGAPQPMQGAMPPQMMGIGQGMPAQTQSLLPWQAMMRG